MTVDFALFLSPEGIALAHRQTAGHWALVGEAPFEGDLDAAMADLKSAAEARGCSDGRVLLVLPDDQVLYTSFMAPADDADSVTARITEGLEGMTPYAVSDLTYDWRAVEADRVKVAVVAQETLGEATGFAEQHGFTAAGFAAMPPNERYPGMPLFGEKRPDLPDAAAGMAFGADDWAAAKAAAEAETPAPDAPKEPREDAAPATASEDAPEDAPDTDAAPMADETASDDASPAAQDDEIAELPEGSGDGAKPERDDAAADEAETPPAPIADPTLDQPITPLADADDPAAPAAEEEAPAAEAAPAPEPETPPAPVAKTDAPKDKSAPEAAAPVASRGKARKPASDSKPLTAEKGDAAATPARAARFTPVAAPRDSVAPEAAQGSDASDTAAEAPALTFGARRGKAPKPSGDAGKIVSARQGRLGFGDSSGQGGAVLHPDAAPSRSSTATGQSGTAPAGAARPGGRLTAQLARVRDVSKARPRPEPETPAPQPSGPPEPASRPDPMPDIAARDTAASDDRPGRFSGLLRRRGGQLSAPDPAADAAGSGAATGVATADGSLTSGLLARKPVETKGPSFRTGLVLTLILLVLLALIAVWSVLFLPDSPMARLFIGDRGDEAELALEDPFDAPVPPAAITAPPAMGLRDGGAAPDAAEDPADDTEMAALDPALEAQPPLAEPVPEPTPDPVIEAPAEEPLPDIDAELDLPPLPPLPEEALPSLEETQAIYESDGIWPRTPARPFFSEFNLIDDIYVASIDPTITALDAIALPPAGLNPDERLRRVPPPPPFGAEIERDARGLVAATPEGVLTPEGAFVVLGRPAVEAVPRPRELAPAVEEAPEAGIEDAILGTFQPTPRPGNLEETRQRQLLGGLTVTELAGLRPGPRPLSAQEAAARASLFPRDDAVAEDGAEADAPPAEEVIAGTRLAVAESLLPARRPGNIEAIVAAAERAPARAVAVSAIAPAPSIPSNADVSRAATERNAIRLRDLNLIGVTGSPSNRRALVRLPSGRFVRVGVGDRLNGGRVAAIGEASLQYVRNGRNITLEIPG